MNLPELQTDPAAFRRELLIDADGEPKRFADVAESWQTTDLESLDSGWCKVAGLDVEPQYKRAWIERPRGHSKSTDEAIMAAWVLFAARHKINGVIAAADRDQGRIIRDCIERLVRLNSWLAKFLDVQAFRVVNKVTGSEVEIISSDVGSSYGLQPSFIIADEVCHWQNGGMWESLFSSAAKRPSCLLVVLTNAGFQTSWVWPLREAIRTDERWYFSRLDRPSASWITADILDEQRRLLPPAAYARLWENVWAGGEGDALDVDDIEAAFSLSGPLSGPEPGWQYVAGCDLAYRSDASAFVVLAKDVGWIERKEIEAKPVGNRTMRAMQDLGFMDSPAAEYETTTHPGSGRYKLAFLELWKPSAGRTVDLNEVEKKILEISQRFKVQQIGVDPFQAISMCQRLRSKGIPVSEITFSPANLQSMASEVLGCFVSRCITLWRDVDLEADLRSLRVVERQHGFRLVSPRSKSSEAGSGHGDSVTALSLALHVGKHVRFDTTSIASRDVVLYCPSNGGQPD